MEYPSIQAARLPGAEPIKDEHGRQISSLNNFWEWAYSNTVDNAQRGVLAEYLVACALGVAGGVRTNWEKYDLLTPEGISVEVKASGYIQNWYQKKLSTATFSIQPTLAWDEKTATYATEKTRQADVYVFCLHKHTEQESVNPLDLSQWDFYILPTSVLNEKAGAQKSIRLNALISMGAKKVEYGAIHQTIIEMASHK